MSQTSKEAREGGKESRMNDDCLLCFVSLMLVHQPLIHSCEQDQCKNEFSRVTRWQFFDHPILSQTDSCCFDPSPPIAPICCDSSALPTPCCSSSCTIAPSVPLQSVPSFLPSFLLSSSTHRPSHPAAIITLSFDLTTTRELPSLAISNS